MEKNLAEQYSMFFSKKVSLVKKLDSMKSLSQMPEHQILFFLAQACERKRPIILQMNKTNHVLSINEKKGTISYFQNKSGMFVLESTNSQLTHMLSYKDVRHIRLA
ncbi:hypothetical protein [Carnobacterium funditum]|uniref:hypothetical protein n=1 Tax=Carnobacterium funditum TaxID=2752 RepID=UPI0005502CC4|nr:hypothetical protein [Carnobacterium funditum]